MTKQHGLKIETTPRIRSRIHRGMAEFGLASCLMLAGCGAGSSSDSGSSSSSAPTAASPATTATVNMVVTDTPSAAITVLSLQVQITGAVLQPGDVALLPRPITVDLAQLVTDTGFLTSSVIDSATYTSLEMSFANPQVTIMNNTGAAIALAGQSCAVGATCTFAPALNNATVTISSGIFPLTVTASSSTGLNLDLSIPDLLQSDLSLTFANGKSVNLSLLPGDSSASQQASVDDVLASITSISGNMVNVTTALGDSLVLTSSDSTLYNYPVSVCSTANAACLSNGQIVTADLSLLDNGSLAINSVSYLGASGSQLVKALVLSTNTFSSTPTAQLLLHHGLNTPTLSAGEIASVSLPGVTNFSVGAAVYPAVSTGSFSSAQDLLPGQEVIVTVGSDLQTGTAPSFSTNAVYLEPSQIIGEVTAIDTPDASLEIASLSGLFTASNLSIQQIGLQTDSTTSFVGFNGSSISAVATGDLIAAKGPIFRTTSGSDPTLSAINVRYRAASN